MEKNQRNDLLFTMEYYFHNMQIPSYMRESLADYVMYRNPVGSFLQAVLSNDLKEAIAKADDTNIKNIPAYINWLYNYAPSLCYGSKKNYTDWIKR